MFPETKLRPKLFSNRFADARVVYQTITFGYGLQMVSYSNFNAIEKNATNIFLREYHEFKTDLLRKEDYHKNAKEAKSLSIKETAFKILKMFALEQCDRS